ncbi:hypothetical protein MESS2_1030191 [Mesorhizobium metallidurans STM 2683]|uniref:Uncharacterized protein n=1 Tax=Mesorhizobium metallidurans STM 2683 TaxID=1297569 RepID=M5EF88_9HYPH|nr:hypothetical protein MESS2_1030191 [Mesorhizobium metallidurans STM 2683]
MFEPQSINNPRFPSALSLDDACLASVPTRRRSHSDLSGSLNDQADNWMNRPNPSALKICAACWVFLLSFVANWTIGAVAAMNILCLRIAPRPRLTVPLDINA